MDEGWIDKERMKGWMDKERMKDGRMKNACRTYKGWMKDG